MKKIFVLCLTVALCLCCLASCEMLHTAFNVGEHTYEYIQYETGHFKQYTCGCPSPDIMGMHCDNDENGICDICGYDQMHKLVYEAVEEIGHKINCSLDCEDYAAFGQHYDKNNDKLCDVCQYSMENVCSYEWVCDIVYHTSNPTCGCCVPIPENSYKHIDHDNNEICDVCTYDLSGKD